MSRALALTTLVLLGCGGGAAEGPTETTSPAPAMRPASAPPAATEERAVRVAFSEASGTSGCFFFSGPATPGVEVREVHGAAATLQEASGTLSLDFGGGVVFRGPTSDARIVREETYDYQGKWGITETIEFEVVGDAQWRGRYRYEECEMDTGNACPGRCRIDAAITLD